MADPSNETLSLKTSLGEVAAKGTTVVLLVALVVLGGLALREHGRRDAAEQRIESLLQQQNKLLHDQTIELRTEIDDVRCNVAIDIFVHQFSRGAVEWDLLPTQWYSCLPEYSKGMPQKVR